MWTWDLILGKHLVKGEVWGQDLTEMQGRVRGWPPKQSTGWLQEAPWGDLITWGPLSPENGCQPSKPRDWQENSSQRSLQLNRSQRQGCHEREREIYVPVTRTREIHVWVLRVCCLSNGTISTIVIILLVEPYANIALKVGSVIFSPWLTCFL